MATSVIFQTLFDQVETPLLAGVSGLVLSFSNYARAPIQAAMVLYVALTGWMMVQGKGGSSGQVLAHILKLALIAWFVTDATVYTTWVQNFFLTQLPADFSSAVVQGNNGQAVTSAGAFDIVWRQAWQAGLSVWQRLSVADLGEEIAVVLFWLFGIVAVGVAFAIWLKSQVVMGLYIIIGPLMIGLALFSATREIFARWISGLISTLFLQVGILILLALMLRVAAALVVQIMAYNGSNMYEQLGLLWGGVAVFVLLLILVWQMPAWASSLAGGMQFHAGAMALLLLSQVRGATGVVGATGSAMNRGADRIREGMRRPAQRSLSLRGGR